ncbi:hypothetical protein D3C81_991120 [compost metagenome]
MPVFCQNSAAVRWSDDPAPDEAKLTLPGFFFMCATSSCTFFAGNCGLTTSTLGARTATVSRSKSLTGS